MKETGSVVFCVSLLAGGLSALHQNRQRPPNELPFFALSEFRNDTESGRPGNVTSAGPGCCRTTSDQWELSGAKIQLFIRLLWDLGSF